MLKAILFDLDDTLIDWGEFFEAWDKVEAPHVKSVHQYLSSMGEAIPPLKTYQSEYSTRARAAWANARNTLLAPHLGRILVEAAVAVGVPPEQVDMDACLSAYNWRAVPGTSAFPDVAEALQTLRDRGIRFGIVTNAFQPMVLRDVEMAGHGLLDFFPECRLSAADVGYLKPHPSIFQRALNCLGTKPEETVFVGDNPTADIAGAQAAGMQAILRVIPRRKQLLSGLVVPDASVHSLLELPQIFDKWFPGWGEPSLNGGTANPA